MDAQQKITGIGHDISNSYLHLCTGSLRQTGMTELRRRRVYALSFMPPTFQYQNRLKNDVGSNSLEIDEL